MPLSTRRSFTRRTPRGLFGSRKADMAGLTAISTRSRMIRPGHRPVLNINPVTPAAKTSRARRGVVLPLTIPELIAASARRLMRV
jgi:hypothetical protein